MELLMLQVIQIGPILNN